MEFTNDRFEHLVVVIRDEINAEHARETALLTASAHSTKQEQMVVWQQRFASVDRIARTLEAYGLTGGLDEADFLTYSLHQWRAVHQQVPYSLLLAL